MAHGRGSSEQLACAGVSSRVVSIPRCTADGLWQPPQPSRMVAAALAAALLTAAALCPPAEGAVAEIGPTASGALCSVLACLSEGWKLGGLAAQLPYPGASSPADPQPICPGPTLHYWRQHPCTEHATATCLHALPSVPPARYTSVGSRICSWTAAACPSATAWWTQRSATAHSQGRRSWCQASTVLRSQSCSACLVAVAASEGARDAARCS